MLVLLVLLGLSGPPRHVLPPLPIISVAQPVKTPKPHNARQRKLIARGCIKIALHEWVCPMPKPTKR